MFIFTFTAAILSVFCFGFAAFLLLKHWSNILAVYLALYVMAVGLWIGSNAMADLAQTPAQNILWSGLAVIGSAFTMSFYLCFAYVYTHRRHPALPFLAGFFLPTAFFSLTAFSKLSVAETMFPVGEPSQIVPGPIYPFLLAFIIFSLAYGLVQLSLYSLRRASPREQAQINYLQFGFLTTFVSCAVFNIILPLFGEYRFYSLGPQFSIVMIGLTAYVVLRQRLLDIKTVIQRGVIYTLIIGFIAVCYSAVVSLLLTFASGLTDQAYLIAVVITTCLSVICFEPLKQFFVRVTDSTFYRHRMSHEAAVDAFSHAINESHSPGQMVYGITATVREVFRAEAVSFIVLNQKVACAESTRPMSLQECHQLTDECPAETVPATDLIIPLIFEGHIVALLCLGHKKSGEPYFSDDLALLTSFSHQAALAIDKSQRYLQAKSQAARLQDQHHRDEEAMRLSLAKAEQGLNDVSRALSLVAELKNRALAAPEQSIGSIEDDLARLEDSARLAGQTIGRALPYAASASFSLSALCQRLTDHFVSLAERQGGVLRTEIAPDLIVFGPSHSVEDTLVTTIGTALRYADDRHEIVVTLKKVGDRAELCVVTNGHSMPVTELPPYFDQLRRSSLFGDSMGTGLTLSLTLHEVSLCDEVLGVKSTADDATEVCFTFKLDTK